MQDLSLIQKVGTQMMIKEKYINDDYVSMEENIIDNWLVRI